MVKPSGTRRLLLTAAIEESSDSSAAGRPAQTSEQSLFEIKSALWQQTGPVAPGTARTKTSLGFFVIGRVLW